MMQNGIVFLLPPLALLTDATGYGSLPTPLSRDWKGACGRARKGIGRDLPSVAKNFPTPTAHDATVTKARPPEKMVRKDGRNVLRTPSLAETLLQEKDFPYTKQDLEKKQERKNYKTAKHSGRPQLHKAGGHHRGR